MTDWEQALGIQPTAKAAYQEQRKLKTEQDEIVQKKIKLLQAKMEKSSLPQSSLKLRPTKQSTQEQQRLLNREAILQLSRYLRDHHLPNPYALRFQIKGPIFDENLARKLLVAINNMRQQKLSTKRHFEHKLADSKLEEQHHKHYTFEI